MAKIMVCRCEDEDWEKSMRKSSLRRILNLGRLIDPQNSYENSKISSCRWTLDHLKMVATLLTNLFFNRSRLQTKDISHLPNHSHAASACCFDLLNKRQVVRRVHGLDVNSHASRSSCKFWNLCVTSWLQSKTKMWNWVKLNSWET